MNYSIVIFGASGDLTSRKLVPALYSLFCKKRLPENTRIIGFSRTEYTDTAWREALAASTARFVGSSFDKEAWVRFAEFVHYQPGDLSQAMDLAALGQRLSELESRTPSTRLYYLSTAPKFYEAAIAGLGAQGLVDESDGGVRRMVVEKPFGTNLASARALNQAVHRVLPEKRVFRIDHYLGKESVQNLLVLRFANTIFEPVWNRNYVDHVQITVAEEVEVGRRGDYYDGSGALRDMVQNHLLQLLMFTAMEAPSRLDADLVRDEKAKVLRSIRVPDAASVERDTVRGQYRKYRDEPGVARGTTTATFAALKLSVDNWRWQGVPFYLRTGKAMSCRTTQIIIQFREPPHMMFSKTRAGALDANRLVLQIQPGEGIQLHFQTKVPDAGMQLRMTDLEFSFREEFRAGMPEAYERLLLDALLGDASLFARADEVELAWELIDPIQRTWDEQQRPSLRFYDSGGWGPQESTEWMAEQGREWFDVCPVLRSVPPPPR